MDELTTLAQKTQLPIHYRKATLVSENLNKSEHFVDVIWTTGAKVKRCLPTGEYFEETLKVSPDAVRLERLNQGAPVLNGHHNTNLDDVIGVVDSAWIADGKGYARLKFSARDTVKPILRDIEQGILRHCSVGYIVHQFQDISTDKDTVRIMQAIDWEPQELSIVAIGADPDAQIRTSQAAFYPCTIMGRQQFLTTIGANPMTIATEGDTEKNKQVPDPIITKERARIADIFKLVRSAQLKPQFAEDLIQSGDSLDQARTKIIDAWGTDEKNNDTRAQHRLVMGEQDETTTRHQGIETALLHRFNPKVYQVTEQAKPYLNYNLLELARLFVNDPSTQTMSRLQLAERALHTSSDFPQILANVANKTLRNAYTESAQTFKPFVRITSVNDFKMISRVQLGDGVKLDPVSEHGEFTYGTFGEAEEQYKVATYGKIIGISRQTLINDDLDAFTRIPQLFGRAAANLESDLVYKIFHDNHLMHDGKALFSKNHHNLADKGTTLSIDALATARTAMRLQTGLNETRLNLYPSLLLVPASLELSADQLISQNFQATQSGDINPFAGRLQIIVEPRLDADPNTPYAWYLIADSTQVDLVELAYLSGNQGISIETRNGFEVDGVEIKARLDVGVKAIDWRGFYKNSGQIPNGTKTK